MPSKIATKAFKITGMSMGMMLATMVVGAGLATAGWWYTDHLVLSFGQGLEINEVKGGGGPACQPPVGQSEGESVPGNVSRVIKENGFTKTQVAMFKCKMGEIFRQRIIVTNGTKAIVPDKGKCISYSEGQCTRYEKGILTSGYEFDQWKTVKTEDKVKDDWYNDPKIVKTDGLLKTQKDADGFQ